MPRQPTLHRRPFDAQRWFCGMRPWAWLCLGALLDSVAGDGSEAKWFLVPEDDLASVEAFEYAILRINEMRTSCEGFQLAPLMMQNYRPAEVYVRHHDMFSSYRLRLEPAFNLAPSPIKVQIARQHSITDLSLFELTSVHPLPCDLFSAMDDAELLVPWKGDAAEKAMEAAMSLLNRQRKILCPQRPELQLQRLVAASQQPVEGKVIRLVLEMREASQSFRTESFTDIVLVSYALDQDVPGECTVSPEIYPARSPCKMTFTEQEQSAEGSKDDAGPKQAEERRLRGSSSEPRNRSAPHLDGATPPEAHRRMSPATRRLSSIVDAAPSGSQVEQVFVDKGLDIPDDFDPRLRRTLCFPRGFSRRQGACGASSAFAATAVASFRECLWQLDEGDQGLGLQFFAAQELVSCDGMGNGCSGGSAASAFYYMKHEGISRESCSPYRMRCYNDNSGISETAADSKTSQHRSKQFDAASKTCPLTPDPKESACKCLPSVFHFTKPVECGLLPHACPKVKVPHYFHIIGTAEGSTIPLLERHMMQELILAGPLYVSFLVYEDFYDPVSWTESGIYIHKRGNLIGKHASAAVGWGTDSNSRDYWLLLNSFGNGWQQEGYFKIMRGETALQMTKFGAWGADWTHPKLDTSKPTIADVELSFSPVVHDVADAESEEPLSAVFLLVAAFTDEDARMLIRVQGLSNTISVQAKEKEFRTQHVLKMDLLKIGLLDDRAKVQIWAVDQSQNTASWGPFTLDIPSKKQFQNSQVRRLSWSRPLNLTAAPPAAPAEELEPEAWV